MSLSPRIIVILGALATGALTALPMPASGAEESAQCQAPATEIAGLETSRSYKRL